MDPTSTGSKSPKNIGFTFAVASSIASGMSTVVGKWNLQAISPLLMNSLIFSVATVLLTVTVLPIKGIRQVFTLTRRGWFWLGLFSASSQLAVWAFWAGVQRMDPTLATFLNRTEVLIAIFLGIIFLKERFTRAEMVGAVLSIAGIVIMCLTLRAEYSSGFWLVLLGSLLFGVTEFISKIAVRHVEPFVLTYIRNMFLAAAYWIVFWAGGFGYEGLGEVWLGVLALGFLGPILSRLMYFLALKRLDLSKVAVISQSQPVFVIIIAFLALGQLPTFREIVGGIFLTLGCLIMIGVHQPRRWNNRLRSTGR